MHQKHPPAKIALSVDVFVSLIFFISPLAAVEVLSVAAKYASSRTKNPPVKIVTIVFILSLHYHAYA
jgi:hypothetical protein